MGIGFVGRARRLLGRPDLRERPVRGIWRRLYWRLHWRMRPEQPLHVELPAGERLRLGPSGHSLGLYLTEQYNDPDVVAWFEKRLRRGMIVIDGGGHIGEYTLLLHRLVGQEGQVHAFEPDPRMFPYLAENVDALDDPPPGHLTVNQCALGARDGRVSFVLAPDPVASTVQVDAAAGHRVEVTMCTIDTYAARRPLERVDVIKLDIEGAEIDAIEGASGLLSQGVPQYLVIECHSEDAVKTLGERLRGWGYSVAVHRRDDDFPWLAAER